MQQFFWNAFSTGPFTGNPAAVMPLTDDWLPEVTLQAIAAQNFLPETAFYVPMETPGHFKLRWFTPEFEMDLCGHATLATAATIHHLDATAQDSLFFETLSGELVATRKSDGVYELDFPVWQPQPEPMPNGLVAAIGQVPVIDCVMNRRDLILVLPSAEAVRDLQPDIGSLSRIDSAARCVIVTAAGGDNCDFVSRFFAPREGIIEDPVTGSAHCGLIPYWAAKLGKTDMIARQLSARGGRLTCMLAGDRVLIGGNIGLYMEAKAYI